MMGIAICAKRCCWRVYSKKGCPLIHSCHHCLEQSCQRCVACPTSLLRQSLLIPDYYGFTLYATEFPYGSELPQCLQSTSHQQNYSSVLPACGLISSPYTDCLGPIFSEHFLPSIVGVLFICLPLSITFRSFACFQDLMVNNLTSPFSIKTGM